MAALAIKVDKNWTNGYELPKVKNDIAEFKLKYTIGDVMDAFRSQTDTWDAFAADIIKLTAEAFPSGWFFGNKTTFRFEIVLDTRIAFYKLTFYTDLDLNIDLRNYTVKKFSLDE